MTKFLLGFFCALLIAPIAGVCWIGDQQYTLEPVTQVTPTRILVPTVTPTPTATPSPTQPACQVRTVVNPVNVRAGPGASFTLVGPGLKAGTVVQVAEWRTVGTGLWARLCGKVNGQDVWFSASSAGVTK